MVAPDEFDERLAVTIDRAIDRHLDAVERARKDRRAVWLRLHEAGMSYRSLANLTGYGTSTIHVELQRARSERHDA